MLRDPRSRAWRCGVASGLLLLAVLAGCEGESIDGRYMVTARNGAETCGLPGWTPGGTIDGIVFVRQDGDEEAFVELRGALGDSVQASVGTTRFFADEVHQKLDYWVDGVCSTCACQPDVEFRFHAEISGGEISGDLQYWLELNEEPTCTGGRGCAARQELIGMRLE